MTLTRCFIISEGTQLQLCWTMGPHCGLQEGIMRRLLEQQSFSMALQRPEVHTFQNTAMIIAWNWFLIPVWSSCLEARMARE